MRHRHQSLFADRFDAGRQLSKRLIQYQDSRPLILALPRGGVTVGHLLARELQGDLDVARLPLLRPDGEAGETRSPAQGWPTPPVNPRGRTVVVVDDGLAEGSAMAAVLPRVRQQRPSSLIVAVPVADIRRLRAISELADELICLHALSGFDEVGLHYRHFPQVSDEELARLLSGSTRCP